MQKNMENTSSQARRARSFQYATKLSAIVLLLLLSIMIVACGPTVANTTTANNPTPVPTLNLNGSSASPTPSLPGVWCGIWLPDAAPMIGNGSATMYAKFTQNNNGNPVGIANATVTLYVQWGDGYQDPNNHTGYTNAQGVASITLPIGSHGGAINKLSLVTANFVSGNTTCKVDTDRAASFVITAGGKTAKPTGTATNTGGGGNNGGGGNGGFPRKRG